jgi:hypothetical protein
VINAVIEALNEEINAVIEAVLMSIVEVEVVEVQVVIVVIQLHQIAGMEVTEVVENMIEHVNVNVKIIVLQQKKKRRDERKKKKRMMVLRLPYERLSPPTLASLSQRPCNAFIKSTLPMLLD